MKRLVLGLLSIGLFASLAMAATYQFDTVKTNNFYTKAPYADVEMFANISTAKNYAQTNGLTLKVTTAQTPRAALTFNCPVEFTYPGSISVVYGVTFLKQPTINGLYQVFTGTGTVTGLKEVRPEWWGAVGDDSTNSTAAFVSAFGSATSNYTVKLSPGIYRIGTSGNASAYASLILSGKTDLVIEGNGAVIKQMDGTKRTFQLDTCTRVKVKDLTYYGTIDSEGPVGMESAFYLGAAAGDNTDISFDNIHWYKNASNAYYVGSIPTGIQKNIRITNNTMDGGLSFMLTYGVQGLIVDNIKIKHRNTAPGGTGDAQDVDIDIEADVAHGSASNIAISNVTIDGQGSVSNTNTGGSKIAVNCASGASITNIALNNINIYNNIGNYTPTYGSQTSSIYVADANATHDQIINFTADNMNFYNSLGIFIEARNLQFSNVAMDTFTMPALFPSSYGRPIDSTAANSSNNLQIANLKINNWASDRVITVTGPVNINNFHSYNCTGSVIASDKSVYTNMVLDTVGNNTYGAFYASGATPNIVLSSVAFLNSPYIGLMEATGSRAVGAVLNGAIFSGNTTDTNILADQTYTSWMISGVANTPIYADNAAAVAGGLGVGKFYHTTTTAPFAYYVRD